MPRRGKPEAPCRLYAASILVSRGAAAERCGEACPTGALRVDEEGGLAVEPERCVVCLACMALCGPGVVRVVPGWDCPGEA